MSDRPRLKPWLHPILRGRDEVQFGLDPDGVILTGISAGEAELLRGLDGSRSRAQTFGSARHAGVPAARWRELLDLVGRLDLLEPAEQTPLVPGGRHVVIDGGGPLSTEIALVLGRLGVEQVTHDRPAVDLVLAEPRRQEPDLVVIVGLEALDPSHGEIWFHHRIPLLPIVPHGSAVSVGPVVVHGDPAGPCLWCLDLHRGDRDHGWSSVMSQVVGSAARVVPGPSTPDGVSPAVLPFVAGGVALLVLGLLAGRRPPDGLAIEVRTPWPRVDHRRWTRHPRCRHHTDTGAGVA